MALDYPSVVEYAPIGGAAYDEFNDPLPKITLDLANKADAIPFGGGW
jgi:3-isopropylmalate dehydrogenase